MTQERINDIEQKMGQFDSRLTSSENSNKEVLLEVRSFASNVHDLVKEQAVANANYTHQSEINNRIFAEYKELKIEVRANSKYIDTNRNMDAIINKAPMWAFSTLATLVLLVATVVYNSFIGA